MRLLLAALMLPALMACSETRPPFADESSRIAVYAFDREVAREVAEHASACLGDVEFLTGVTLSEGRRPEIWQREQALARPGVLSFYAYGADRITLGRVALYDYGHQLAHEMAHLLGDQPGSWIGAMPQVLEEGVADYVACRFAQELDRQVYWARQQLAGRTVDLEAIWSAPRDVSRFPAMRDLYAVGLLTVHHLGLDAVRQHAEAGTLTIDLVAQALDRQIG